MDRPGPGLWVETDPARLEANARLVRGALGAGCRVLAVVKSAAYGHGSLVAARAFAAGGVHGFAVFRLDEAAELRGSGLRHPVLVLGPLEPQRAGEALDLGVTPTVFDLELAQALAAAARSRGTRAGYHLKVDTGFGRLGVPLAELPGVLHRLAAQDGLEMEGLFSHLACADEPDHPRNSEQLVAFHSAVEAARRAGHAPRMLHLANSAAALSDPSLRLDAARIGLALYGYSPAPGRIELAGLRPALTARCRVIMVKEIPAGTTVGYGARWRASRPSRIAVLPMGYQDGYRRDLDQGGFVVLGGRLAPVVGRVSMELSTVDVTDLPGVRAGQVATVLGQDGDAQVDAWDLARAAGTIPYEVLCALGGRARRAAVRGGAVATGEAG